MAITVGLTLNTFAGDLEPSAPPASTMKTLDEVEARIPIPGSDTPVSVFNISNSGSYYLTGDRVASGHGILVQVDNVTIDLNGYNLIGSGAGNYHGVYMNGRSNIEVRNGTVRNFGRNGIRDASASGQNNRIINVRAISNGLDGFYTGIFLLSANSLIKGCTSSGNTGNGIYIGAGSMVIGNTACSNQNWGIWLSGNNLVDQNTAFNNNQSGGVYGSMNNSVTSTYGTNHAP